MPQSTTEFLHRLRKFVQDESETQFQAQHLLRHGRQRKDAHPALPTAPALSSRSQQALPGSNLQPLCKSWLWCHLSGWSSILCPIIDSVDPESTRPQKWSFIHYGKSCPGFSRLQYFLEITRVGKSYRISGWVTGIIRRRAVPAAFGRRAWITNTR